LRFGVGVQGWVFRVWGFNISTPARKMLMSTKHPVVVAKSSASSLGAPRSTSTNPSSTCRLGFRVEG